MDANISWLVVGLTTVVVPFLTEFLKKRFSVTDKGVYVLLAIVLGCVYVVFTQVLSPELQSKLLALIGTMAYASHVIYEFLIKKKTDEVVVDGGSDEPDPRDFPYDQVFGAAPTQQVKFPKDILKIQDQSAYPDTARACTRFGTTHIHNAQQIVEHGASRQQMQARDIWLEYLAKNPKAQKEGATVQSAIKQFYDDGYIEGYAVCKDDASRKQAIDAGHWILTGSLTGDRAYVRDNKIYRDRTDGKQLGHIFCIVGYDNTGRLAINSYGPNNGYFTIPYAYTGSLFSTYAIIDKDESGSLQAYKDSQLLQKMQDLGVRNGKDPTLQITREQCALMIGRTYNLLKQ